VLSVADPRCDLNAYDTAACQYRSVGVASADALDLITGHASVAARQTLDAGGAVVTDPGLLQGDHVDLRSGDPYAKTSARHQTRMTAVAVAGVPSYGGLPLVYLSPATAQARGWHSQPTLALVKPEHIPSNSLTDRAQRALGNSVYINVERGYESRYSVVLLAMLGAAAVATLAGTSIAVALAMAESRADMATLAAVGASPSRRRLHAMGQAAAVSGLGALLGLGLGALIGISTLAGSNLYPTSAPYRWLALMLIAVPALAIAVAGLFTRSQVTLTRRIA
jgi:putative ABC transport system permease protein